MIEFPYQYLQSQLSNKQVIIALGANPCFDALLNLLDLEQIVIDEPELSTIYINNTFSLNGVSELNSYRYSCSFVFKEEQEQHVYCTSEYVLNLNDKEYNLIDVYPYEYARIGRNGYSKKIDVITDMVITKSRIIADTKKESLSLNIITYFKGTSAFYQYFKEVAPPEEKVLEWTGNIQSPFKSPVYRISTQYEKEISWNFSEKNVNTNSIKLDFESMIHDKYEWKSNVKPSCCNITAEVRLPDDLSAYNGLYMTIKVCDIFQNIPAEICFDNTGINVNTIDTIIVLQKLIGEEFLNEIPDYIMQSGIFSIENVELFFSLTDTGHDYENGYRDKKLDCCLFRFKVLPALPISYFKPDDKDSVGFVIVVRKTKNKSIKDYHIEYRYKWNQYVLFLELYSYLVLEGNFVEIQNENINGTNNFYGLKIEEVNAYGDLISQEFSLTLILSKDTGIKLGNKIFDISCITGMFNYSPAGAVVFIELDFSLFKYINCYLKGEFSVSENGNYGLFLEGGVGEEVSLNSLIQTITGNDLNAANNDIKVRYLNLSFGADDASEISDLLNNPSEFSFKCAIAYDWGTGEIATSFFMKWVPDVYSYNMTAALRVLDFLQLMAACDVEVRDGNFNFLNFVFYGKIGKAQITASYENNNKQIYKFNIKDFSLGEILEELIRLIDNDHDWYLPWPYSILKGLEIKDLDVVIDNSRNTLTARYNINFRLMFLTIRCIELLYDRNNGDFFLNIDVNGSISNNVMRADEPLRLNLLKDVFPMPEGAGENPLKISYLSVGQHIAVELPDTFDGQHFADVFEKIRKAVTKGGTPKVDTGNNWIAAMKFNLLKAFDVTMLMCDPVFYGLEISINKGFELTDPLAGLKVTILYSKVTDTIGMFYARLTFPEIFRKINLGAVSLVLGEVAVAIYTNGNFKIDLGFPWNKDFSNSFGLSYMLFTGQGGFYLGVLNGKTSQQLPEVTSGYFDQVVELGIGMNAGVGLEINAGPLKAGAYVKMVAIFQGVFACYVPQSGDNATYYKVQATAGVVASIYGKVDFVLIQVGFSIDASIAADLTLESYRQTELVLDLNVSVSAYIKIMFINIRFSFDFHWHQVFLLGENKTAPWDADTRLMLGSNIDDYTLEWFQQKILEQKVMVAADVLNFFSYDNGADNGPKEGRVAFLSVLPACDKTFYNILKLFFIRVIKSVRKGGELTENVTPELLAWLETELEKTTVFHEGFSMEMMDGVMNENIEIQYRKGENRNEEDEVTDGIPFPLTPYMIMEWYDKDEGTDIYDLTQTPVTGFDFADRQKSYYDQLDVDTESSLFALRIKEAQETAGTFMFCQYFYMMTRIAVSVIKEYYPEGKESVTLEEAGEMLAQPDIINTVSGMISRFLYGGPRVYIENGDNAYNESLYTYACQQFKASLDIASTELCNRMIMKPAENAPEWMGTQSAEMQWDFYGKDLLYPNGEPETVGPELLPFYKEKELTIELKNPARLAGEENVVFYEAGEILEEGYRIVMRQNNGNETEAVYSKGIMIYVSITKAGDGIYSINTIGYDGMEKLERNIGMIKSMSLYRCATEFDTQKDGLYGIEGNAILFRNNLCLEAEKPVTNVLGGGNDYENSALLTEYDSFLGLLKDATLVNARGYFIELKAEVETGGIPDGCNKMVIWIETDEMADAVMMKGEYAPETVKPLVYTGKTYTVPVYHPGMLAFEIQANENVDENEIENIFQIVNFRIKENDHFNESHESRPVFARNAEGRNVYSQIVPVSRLAKNPTGSPYDGVREGSKVEIDFSRVDILGNEFRHHGLLQAEIKYTDPLCSPVVWPYTCCNYKVRKEKEEYVFCVTFSWKENEGNLLSVNGDNSKLIENAYWQIMCQDVTLKLLLWGNEYLLDIQPLREFISALRRGEIPEDVVYSVSARKVREEDRLIDLSLGIYRDEMLVDKESDGWEKVQSCVVPVKEDMSCIAETYLARSGRNQTIYLAEYPQCTLSDPEFFTIPPLCNHLVNLVGVPVYNMEGETVKADFYNIDMELWTDMFLADMETYIQPDSPCSRQRNVLEQLLACKKTLAGRIADTVRPVYEIQSDRTEHASEFYRNELLKDLAKGKQYDICAVAKSTFMPTDGSKLLVSAKVTNSNYSVKAGKISADGLVDLGFKSHNLTKNAIDKVCLNYSVTDKEICKQGKYDYLTWQKCNADVMELNLPLVYKRFPEKPVLVEQNYETGMAGTDALMPGYGESKWFNWNYIVEFSHEFAAQDTIRLRVVTGERKVRSHANWELPSALACYMYLREEFLKQEELSFDMLVKTVGKVSEVWYTERENRKCTYSQEVELVFTRDSEHNTIRVVSQQKNQDETGIWVKDGNGDWKIAECKEYGYELPETVMSPLTLRVLVEGFDIRTSQQANAYISATRNQIVDNISEQFIYKTEDVGFVQPLLPYIKCPDNISLGAFTETNFISALNGLISHFTKFRMEACCCIPVIQGTEELIYSYVPVCFIPVCDAQDSENVLKEVYNDISGFIKENGLEDEKGINVSISVSFTDNMDESKNVAEFRKLVFLLN